MPKRRFPESFPQEENFNERFVDLESLIERETRILTMHLCTSSGLPDERQQRQHANS